MVDVLGVGLTLGVLCRPVECLIQIELTFGHLQVKFLELSVFFAGSLMDGLRRLQLRAHLICSDGCLAKSGLIKFVVNVFSN